MTSLTAFEIAEWLAGRVAEAMGQEPAEVDREAPFEALGIDSATGVAISGELEDLLDQEVSPTLLWDHSCIDDLAAALEAAPSGATP